MGQVRTQVKVDMVAMAYVVRKGNKTILWMAGNVVACKMCHG